MKHFPNAKRQAEELLCDVLNCSRSDLYVNHNRLLDEKQWTIVQDWVNRRLQGVPLAYLSGKVQFYHCSLIVTPEVLIPRPETEVLVDKIVQDLKNQDLKDKILLDLCCGSGCIGIALKKRFPALSVYLSDYSSEAIALAKQNAKINQVEVTCLVGDLLSSFTPRKAHYIVCNPPYISEEEYNRLDREVKDFEPKVALLAGNTGLEIYEQLARELPACLYPGAQIWFEIGYRQGKMLNEIFRNAGWKNQRVENDWAGHNRFFFLENE